MKLMRMYDRNCHQFTNAGVPVAIPTIRNDFLVFNFFCYNILKISELPLFTNNNVLVAVPI